MKRILSILGTITLIATSTTSLIACDNITKYTEEKLSELKKENKISINGNTLEWIAPQEKPFNQTDNKWYFVIWRGDKNDDWKIIKFNNDIDLNSISLKRKLDHWKLYDLFVSPSGLVIHRYDIASSGNWWKINNDYFKVVYRWYGKYEPDKLVIDPKTGEVTQVKKYK